MGNATLDGVLAELWREVVSADNRREAEHARRDPQAHRLTRVMAKPCSYRYRLAKRQRGTDWVRWCWSCHRNVAGYFLVWRERKTSSGSKHRGAVLRDRWTARRVKRKAAVLAQRRAAASFGPLAVVEGGR